MPSLILCVVLAQLASEAPSPAQVPPAQVPPAQVPPAQVPPAAQSPTASQPVAPAPAMTETPALTPQKPRLLVIDLVDKGAGSDIVGAVNQAIAGQAVASFALGDVVTTQQLRVALDAASTQALLGCETERCMTDVGKSAEATTILGGSVARVGDDVLLTLLAVNAKDGSRVGQQQRKVPINRDLYYYAARQLTALLLTGHAADPRVPVIIKLADNDGGSASFVVDGKEVITGAQATVSLDPGSHEIRIRKSGKAEWKTVVSVQEATPVELVADLVDDTVALWPLAVGTGATAGLAGLGFLYLGGWAANGYDGTFAGVPGYTTTKAESYKHKTPVDSKQLGDKQQDVTLKALGANILIGTAGVLAVVTVALVAADIIFSAGSE